MARRVSSKSRYLPVPTSRRESYALPATMSSSVRSAPSTSHRDDDLDAVAVGQARFGEAAARHDLAVALDREPPAGERELVEQLGEGERGGEFPWAPRSTVMRMGVRT